MVTARQAGELLAIDLGTISVKIGLLDRDGTLLRFARRTYPLDRPRAGWVEQDPVAWWAAIRDAVTDVLQDANRSGLRAVCVGGQGPTLVLVDGEGHPTRPALSWLDQRAAAERTHLAGRIGFDPTYSLIPRLAWLAAHEPDTLADARWALQAWDFIGLRLGGEAAASTIAGDRVWRADWLQAAGLDDEVRRLLPPHVDAGVVYARTAGTWVAELGLPEGIPVVGGVNDGIASLIGAAGGVLGRATDPGGASGGIALCWDRPVTAPGVDCWPGLSAGTAILGGAFAAGGRALDWWAAAGSAGDVPAALRWAEQAPPGSCGLMFLPFLAGERNPLWDAQARGAFLGLSFDHRPAHLARAVVESSGYSLRLLADALAEAGATFQEIRVCGGQAQSRFWNQVKADILHRPVLVPRVSEVALMGSAICAALGAGFYADAVSAGEAMVRTAYRLEPDPTTRATYDALFDVYRDAYASLKPASATLARLAESCGAAPR